MVDTQDMRGKPSRRSSTVKREGGLRAVQRHLDGDERLTTSRLRSKLHKATGANVFSTSAVEAVSEDDIRHLLDIDVRTLAEQLDSLIAEMLDDETKPTGAEMHALRCNIVYHVRAIEHIQKQSVTAIEPELVATT